jgi:hypothetical protein
MVSKIIFACFLSVCLLELVTAQYGTCDYSATINAPGQSVTVNHLPSQGNCRYKVTSPVDTYISMSCSLTLQDYSCYYQYFRSSRSGEMDLKDGTYSCVSGSVNAKSIGNEMVIDFKSAWAGYGNFNCKFTAVAPTNGDCDCGWSVNNKIVGGVVAGVNEFVSHVGLYDKPTKDIFCGGIISEKTFEIAPGILINFSCFSQAKLDHHCW